MSLPSRLQPGPDAYDIVRLGSRARLDGGSAEAFWNAVTRGPDWETVLEMGSHHRVLPTLYAHLKGADVLPRPILDRLKGVARGWAAQVLFLSDEMAAIAGLLRERAVPFLVLKGPSLAAAYGGAALRPFVDNDLLVRRSDFGRVAGALSEAGFWTPPRHPGRLAWHLRVHGESTFGRVRNGRGSTVDLHTALVPPGYGLRPPFEALHARARTIAVGGGEVPVLGWEDLLLALSVNALKDQWDRVRLAADLAEVARFVEDWDRVGELARRGGARRALHLGLLISAAEVGAAYPEAVLREAAADQRAASLAASVRQHLAGAHRRPVLPARDRARLVLLAPDGLRGQARYLGYVGVRRVLEPFLTPVGGLERPPGLPPRER